MVLGSGAGCDPGVGEVWRLQALVAQTKRAVKTTSSDGTGRNRLFIVKAPLYAKRAGTHQDWSFFEVSGADLLLESWNLKLETFLCADF